MRSMASALGALVLLAGGAHAQTPAPWQPEPPAAGWSVTPGLGAGLYYDSNLLLRVNHPASGGWGGLVQPHAELDFVGRRTRFTAGYAGTLQVLHGTGDGNRYDQRARLGSSRVLSPRLTVRGDASYQISPTTDEIIDSTVPFAAVGSRSTQVSGGIEGVLSRRTRLAGTYQFYRLEYDDLSELEPGLGPEFTIPPRGGEAQTPALRVSYDLTRRLVLDGDWSYTRGEVTGDVGQFTMQYVGGGGRYRLREHTTLGAGGGATAISAPAVTLTGWKPAAQAFVEQQAGVNTLSIEYSYSIVPAFSHGGLSRQQRVGAGVHVPLLLGRTYVKGSLALSRDEAVEGLGSGLNTRTLWLQATIGYHVAPWLRAETFVNTARQSSLTHDQYAVQRMRLGVQFVTAKPMRID